MSLNKNTPFEAWGYSPVSAKLTQLCGGRGNSRSLLVSRLLGGQSGLHKILAQNDSLLVFP